MIKITFSQRTLVKMKNHSTAFLFLFYFQSVWFCKGTLVLYKEDDNRMEYYLGNCVMAMVVGQIRIYNYFCADGGGGVADDRYFHC